MSRYTGPRVKVMRALGVELPGLSRKKIERRPMPPGQHGAARKKLSEYGVRLKEKQKLRANYGVTEKQMRRLMSEARRVKGDAGKKLLELLERRLDNVVFRAGFAATIPAARQLVSHGHVLVNGRRVDIASFRVKRSDVVTLVEGMRSNPQVQSSLGDDQHPRPAWLDVDRAQAAARVLDLPDETSVPFPLQIQLVVEFYAQSVLPRRGSLLLTEPLTAAAAPTVTAPTALAAGSTAAAPRPAPPAGRPPLRAGCAAARAST